MTPERCEEPESLRGGAGVVTVSGHRWQRVYPSRLVRWHWWDRPRS
jgi:hypothetical protein